MDKNNFYETFGIPACGKSFYVNDLCDENVVNVNRKYLIHKNRMI